MVRQIRECICSIFSVLSCRLYVCKNTKKINIYVLLVPNCCIDTSTVILVPLLYHTYIHTNLYSAKNRENESEALYGVIQPYRVRCTRWGVASCVSFSNKNWAQFRSVQPLFQSLPPCLIHRQTTERVTSIAIGRIIYMMHACDTA